MKRAKSGIFIIGPIQGAVGERIAELQATHDPRILKLGKPHFESLSGGSTFAELTKGTFKRMKILTPPHALVQQFQQLVSPLFKSIETHLKANTSLKAIRDARVSDESVALNHLMD